MRSLRTSPDHNVRQFVGRAEELAFLAAVVDAERPDPRWSSSMDRGRRQTSLVEATAASPVRSADMAGGRRPDRPDATRGRQCARGGHGTRSRRRCRRRDRRVRASGHWNGGSRKRSFRASRRHGGAVTSRRPPGPAWVTLRSDRCASLPLWNLPADDTRRLLGQLGVGGADVDSIIAATWSPAGVPAGAPHA